MRQKKVLVFGTFDRLHPGHRFFLRSAKKQGNYLVVVVARDANVRKLKGKLPHDRERTRLAMLRSNKVVDYARLGYKTWRRRFELLHKIKPQIVCLGYDQHVILPTGPWRIIRLPAFAPHKYKSSLLPRK